MSKSWDAFFSYSVGPRRLNQEKVVEIRNFLTSELHISSWIDVVEMKSGELSKKVFEGVKGSKLFISFITGEYSDSKNCMNELCLAKKFGKEIIYFINEDTSGMDHAAITKNIIKEIAFYIGTSQFYTRKEDLLSALRNSLIKLGVSKVNY
jgi:hypothetical protein